MDFIQLFRSIALAVGFSVWTPDVLGSCAAAPSGLVSWWKADTNADDVVSGNTGVLQNVGYTNGVVGQAFSFDPNSFPYGTYTGVQVPDQPAYALTNSLTIEGWVRPRGDGYVIFWRGDNAASSENKAEVGASNQQCDRIQCAFETSGNLSEILIASRPINRTNAAFPLSILNDRAPLPFQNQCALEGIVPELP
jgi:hypothetical protein